MTENKRFTIKGIDNFNYGIKVTDVIMDDGIELPQSTVCDLLNDLSTENAELKQSYIQLKHRHSLLQDVCLDAECDRDSYHKDVLSLEKENEQLKQFQEDVTNLNHMKIKLCNNCIYWRMGTASLNDNYCSLTDEWKDWEGTCEKWKGYHD